MTLPALIKDLEETIARLKREAESEDKNDLSQAYLLGRIDSFTMALARVRGLETTVTIGRELSRN